MILIGTQLAWHTDWSVVFERDAPLVLEIGFGNGQFLIDLAQRDAHHNVLGIEISNPSMRRAEQKVKSQQLSNVRLLFGDAKAILWTAFLPASLQAVYINFPDPWPKSSHHHRRLINDTFLHLLATRMPPQAVLEIATDHADYQEWIAEHMARTPYFDSTTGAVYVTEDLERVRTKYEQQALDAGIPCHYYKYQRNTVQADPIFPIPQEFPMPHAIIKLPLTRDDIQAKFTPSEFSHGDVTVRLLNMYQAVNHEFLLIEAFIKEEPQSQRIGFVIKARDWNEWKVALHEIGFPRVTAGVHLAVYHIATWLTGLHVDAGLVRHNLQLP